MYIYLYIYIYIYIWGGVFKKHKLILEYISDSRKKNAKL